MKVTIAIYIILIMGYILIKDPSLVISIYENYYAITYRFVIIIIGVIYALFKVIALIKNN